jgi:hypothetical protein
MGFFDRIRENDRKLRESNRTAKAKRQNMTLAEYDAAEAKKAAKNTPEAKRKEVEAMRAAFQKRSDESSKSFRSWLNEDRLPKYMQQPGQDAYGRKRVKKDMPSPYRVAKFTDSLGGELKPSNSGVKVPLRQKTSEVVMGTASVPTAAEPTPARPVPQATRTVSTPSPAPKPRNYSTEAADKLKKLGLGEDNAVMKKLRERSEMSQEERDKPLSSTNRYADKLKALGLAKGGKINGCAVKGKTKGRYI